MSSIATGKRPITPKSKQRFKIFILNLCVFFFLEQRNRNGEDVYVRTSLPPLVEGPVYGTLLCHIPKLRWNTKYQSLSRSVSIKIAWWGEEETSALFK